MKKTAAQKAADKESHRKAMAVFAAMGGPMDTIKYASKSSYGVFYQVNIYQDGKISCNCKGWTFMRHGRRECTHVMETAWKKGKQITWDNDGISHLTS